MVRLEVFNLLGQHLATLATRLGFHTAVWDAIDGAGRPRECISTVTVGVESQTGRMVLIRTSGCLGCRSRFCLVWRLVAMDRLGGVSRSMGWSLRAAGWLPMWIGPFAESDMGPVELVVEAHPAGKALGDDDSLFDLSDLFNTRKKRKRISTMIPCSICPICSPRSANGCTAKVGSDCYLGFKPR